MAWPSEITSVSRACILFQTVDGLVEFFPDRFTMWIVLQLAMFPLYHMSSWSPTMVIRKLSDFLRKKSVTFKGGLFPFLPSATLCLRFCRIPGHGLLLFPLLQLQHSPGSVSGLLPVCCGHVKEAESSYCNYLRFWAFFYASHPVTQNRGKPLCPKPSYLLSPTQCFLGKGDCGNLGKGLVTILRSKSSVCTKLARLPAGPTQERGNLCPMTKTAQM